MKAVTAATVMIMLAGAASAQTLDDLKNDGKNPDNVLTYGMGYSLNRYSPLKQIDKATVKRLVLSCATEDDRAVLDDAAESLVGLLRRPQAQEGIGHFMAKTLPPWAKE